MDEDKVVIPMNVNTLEQITGFDGTKSKGSVLQSNLPRTHPRLKSRPTLAGSSHIIFLPKPCIPFSKALQACFCLVGQTIITFQGGIHVECPSNAIRKGQCSRLHHTRYKCV